MAAGVRVWAMVAALGILAACGGGVTAIRGGGASAVTAPPPSETADAPD